MRWMSPSFLICALLGCSGGSADRDENITSQKTTAAQSQQMDLLQQPDRSNFQQFLTEHPSLDSIAVTPESNGSLLKSAKIAWKWRQMRDVSAERVPFEAARFVGYFEGVCDSIPPAWWRDRFAHCIVPEEGRYVVFRESHDETWRRRLSGSFLASGEWEFLVDSDGAVVWSNKGTVVKIPHSIPHPSYHGIETLTIGEDATRLYASFFGRIGYSHELIAIDKASGKIVWRKPVWATGLYMWSGPIPESDHRVQIVVESGEVRVFGACIQGAYCEVFRAEDGYATFRFVSRAI